MSRFRSIGIQYGDDALSPLIDGKLFFFESGTNTPKDTFADIDETIANTNPVILTGAGRQPNIFFTGSARVILTDKDSVQIEVRDPLSQDTFEGVFSSWNSSSTYDSPDIVTGSNGLFYITLTNDNQDNDPTTDAVNWTEIRFTRIWNLNESYSIGRIVEASDGFLYTSKINSNLNNDPVTDGVSWESSSGAKQWSVSRTYELNDSVVGSNGKFYTSRTNGNIGNDPVAGLGVNWWGYQAPTLQTFTASGTWNRPDGCTHIVVEGVGGGGSGGGSGSNVAGYRGGGGGGGGGYARSTVDVIGVASLSLTVGLGGAAVIFSAPGISGGSTSIAGVIVASGGVGGGAGDSQGVGGLGGVGTTGDVLKYGVRGDNGSGFGGNVSAFWGGGGGHSELGGNGRSARGFNQPGTSSDAFQAGEGGNGASVAAPASAEFSSSAGADGEIQVHEFYD